MECSLPGSSVHGISQARILEWVAISFSRESSQPRDQNWVSCNDRWTFCRWGPGKATVQKTGIVKSHCHSRLEWQRRRRYCSPGVESLDWNQGDAQKKQPQQRFQENVSRPVTQCAAHIAQTSHTSREFFQKSSFSVSLTICGISEQWRRVIKVTELIASG